MNEEIFDLNELCEINKHFMSSMMCNFIWRENDKEKKSYVYSIRYAFNIFVVAFHFYGFKKIIIIV